MKMHELLDDGGTESGLKKYKHVGKHLYVKSDGLDLDSVTEKEIKDVQVVFLMGGGGMRLRHVTNDKYSKHMIQIDGKPMSRYMFDLWQKAGFKNFCFLVDDTHRGETIQNYYRSGSDFGVNNKYSVEHGKLGSGGALKLAIEKGVITNSFVNHFPDDQIINYDDFPLDFTRVFIAAMKKGYQAVVVCVPGKLYRYGEVVDKDGEVVDFIEKPFIVKDTNTGIFGISSSAFPMLKGLPNGEVKVERTVLKQLAQNKKMFKVLMPSEYWIPVNDETNLKKLHEMVCKHK
jgi:NDP-sugar pyrophosphorylase family protein